MRQQGYSPHTSTESACLRARRGSCTRCSTSWQTTDKRLALLQVDMANAFNSCDRGRLLRELYALPELQSVYRVADFAYSQPSVLVLSGCDGRMIESAQGVRQGDPLSALLFGVYMKQLLEQVSDVTGVRVYGFFDDVNLLGSPQQLMAALSHLQTRCLRRRCS